jgi:hypothetical protein
MMRGLPVVTISLLAAGLIMTVVIMEAAGAAVHRNSMKKRAAPDPTKTPATTKAPATKKLTTTKKPAPTTKPWPNSNGHNACRCNAGWQMTDPCAKYANDMVHGSKKPYCYNAWASWYCEIYSQQAHEDFNRCCNQHNRGGLECRW